MKPILIILIKMDMKAMIVFLQERFINRRLQFLISSIVQVLEEVQILKKISLKLLVTNIIFQFLIVLENVST